MAEAPDVSQYGVRGYQVLDIESARALEESLFDPSVRQSPARLGSLLADGFLEFGASGRIFSKQDVLDAAEDLPDVITPLTDLQVTGLGKDVALVTYRSVTRDADGSMHSALRSSIWVHADGRWQMRFHQGTPASV